MRGCYTAQYKIGSLAASKTVMYITAPANKVVEILGATVTQETNATNFQFSIGIDNVTTLGTPTATGVTPTPHEKGDQAAGSTVQANVTANEPTYGSRITGEGAASLVGYRYEPPTEADRIYVQGGATVGIRMLTTPSSSDFDIRLTFREIG
jgi:hypothetical protein